MVNGYIIHWLSIHFSCIVFVYFFNRQAKRAKSELDRALQARHVGGWIVRKIGGTWGNQEKEGGTLS